MFFCFSFFILTLAYKFGTLSQKLRSVLSLIIYMKKFLYCDWLRETQFFGNTVQKKGN